jgi:hypothetical protein
MNYQPWPLNGSLDGFGPVLTVSTVSTVSITVSAPRLYQQHSSCHLPTEHTSMSKKVKTPSKAANSAASSVASSVATSVTKSPAAKSASKQPVDPVLLKNAIKALLDFEHKNEEAANEKKLFASNAKPVFLQV